MAKARQSEPISSRKSAGNPRARSARLQNAARAVSPIRRITRSKGQNAKPHSGATSITRPAKKVSLRKQDKENIKSKSRTNDSHDADAEDIPVKGKKAKSTSNVEPLSRSTANMQVALRTEDRGGKNVGGPSVGRGGKPSKTAIPVALAWRSSVHQADLQRENAELKEIVRNLKARVKNNKVGDGSIAKPTGCVGSREYKLRYHMKLAHDGDLYRRILRTVRDLCHEARIDFDVSYRNQSMINLGKLFAAASERQPYLKRFQNDWATGEIVRQFITSRRKYEKQKAKRAEENRMEIDGEGEMEDQSGDDSNKEAAEGSDDEGEGEGEGEEEEEEDEDSEEGEGDSDDEGEDDEDVGKGEGYCSDNLTFDRHWNATVGYPLEAEHGDEDTESSQSGSGSEV